jgi:hypothetical protein
VVEVPACGRLDEAVDADHQLRHDIAVDRAREALHRVPARVRAGDLARDAEGARDVGRLGAALGRQLRRERRAERVHDHVGVDHRDQLAPQRMLGQQMAEALDHALREVLAQIALEPGVVAEVEASRSRASARLA